jgi:hypothetical protein
VFAKDAVAANKWLTDRSDYFRCPPVEMLRRDEVGVAWVLSYLREARPA